MIQITNPVRNALFIICGLTILLTGCFSKGEEFRPDQVIENALKTDGTVTYYAESESTFIENDDVQSISEMKEWMDADGKMRLETIEDNGEEVTVINDLQKIRIFDKKSNELMETDASELEDLVNSPKEEMLLLIEGIQDTHSIEYIGEEEMIGRKTHHIKAMPRDQTSLQGEQQFWFDAEHWVTLKHISLFGDSKNEVRYTLFEVEKEFDEDIFSIEVPEDVTVVDLDALLEENKITLEEMIDRMAHTFLYFLENDSIQMESVTTLKIEEDDFEQFTIEYEKDGLPLLSLVIEEGEGYIGDSEDAEELSINDQTVYFTSIYDHDSYTWSADGVHYEIWMNDPSVTQEEMIKMIEEMETIDDV